MFLARCHQRPSPFWETQTFSPPTCSSVPSSTIPDFGACTLMSQRHREIISSTLLVVSMLVRLSTMLVGSRIGSSSIRGWRRRIFPTWELRSNAATTPTSASQMLSRTSVSPLGRQSMTKLSEFHVIFIKGLMMAYLKGISPGACAICSAGRRLVNHRW